MSINRTYLAMALALVVALVLMSLPEAQQRAIAARCQSTFWAGGQWLFSSVIRFARSEQKTRFLLTQNVQLALKNMRLREAAQENERLRQAVKFKNRNALQELILAEVIGRDPDLINDAITIGVGRDRGVEQDWPVITASGLVGHISQVQEHSSIVRLAMRSNISALVQGRRAQGIVRWVHGNRFRLDFLDASSIIEKGDIVVSSGLGGRFPKGLTIGYIDEIRQRENEPLFKEVFLISSVDFLKIEEVFVLRPEGVPARPAGG